MAVQWLRYCTASNLLAFITSTWAKSCNTGTEVNSCCGSLAPQLHRLLQNTSPAWLGIHAPSGPHCHEVQGLKEQYEPSPPKDEVNYSTKGKQTSVPQFPWGIELSEHGCCPSMVPLNSFRCPSVLQQVLQLLPGTLPPTPEQGSQPPTLHQRAQGTKLPTGFLRKADRKKWITSEKEISNCFKPRVHWG